MCVCVCAFTDVDGGGGRGEYRTGDRARVRDASEIDRSTHASGGKRRRRLDRYDSVVDALWPATVRNTRTERF